MRTVYVTTQGATVRKEGDVLLIQKGEEVLERLHLFKVTQLVLFGNIGLTTPTIATLLRAGIDTVFMSIHGKYRGRLVAQDTKNIVLRRAQFRRLDDPAFVLEAARTIVCGKLQNQRTLLLRTARATEIPGSDQAALLLRKAREGSEKASTLEALRGYEGKGSAAYFRWLRQALKQDLGFNQRLVRPPPDPVNALLSLGYTLLGNAIQTAINIVGLDPYLGSLHVVDYGRPSLTLDLMEEFRPVIVDSIVLNVINHRILTAADFQQEATGSPDQEEQDPFDEEVITEHGVPPRPVRLTSSGMKRFITHFEARVRQPIFYPGTNQRLQYRQIFEQQVRLFARYLKGEVDAYTPFLIR